MDRQKNTLVRGCKINCLARLGPLRPEEALAPIY